MATINIVAKSGVKMAVSTGARFSMTLFLASTSHAAPTTAPAAPDGMHPGENLVDRLGTIG